MAKKILIKKKQEKRKPNIEQIHCVVRYTFVKTIFSILL